MSEGIRSCISEEFGESSADGIDLTLIIFQKRCLACELAALMALSCITVYF